MRFSFLTLCQCLALVGASTASADATSASASASASMIRRMEKGDDCEPYEIDFVLVEGDSIRSAVEQEIVEMLSVVGIKVNTRKLSKEEYNAAETAGDFHMSFSETWGAPVRTAVC